MCAQLEKTTAFIVALMCLGMQICKMEASVLQNKVQLRKILLHTKVGNAAQMCEQQKF